MDKMYQTNNNRPEPPAVGSERDSPSAVPFSAMQLQEIWTAVERKLDSCLWYRLQCTDCDHAAEMLGVETDTVRDWIKRGKLPASKPGKEYLIRLSDIDIFLRLHATVFCMDGRRNKTTFS